MTEMLHLYLLLGGEGVVDQENPDIPKPAVEEGGEREEDCIMKTQGLKA